MSRAIYCPKHGVIKPTHPEDAARGLFQRYKRGKAIYAMVCDLCGCELPMGADCVAWSQPASMREWEHQYIKVTP